MALKKLTTPGVNPGGVDKLYGEDWNRLIDALTGGVTENLTFNGTLTINGAVTLGAAVNFGGYTATNLVAGSPTFNTRVDIASVNDQAIVATGSGNIGVELRSTSATPTIYFDFTKSSTSSVGIGTPDYTARLTWTGSTNVLSFDSFAGVTFNQNVKLSDIHVELGTTTGTKIATATTQKLGFWNATPVVQPTGIADADGTLADITTKFNSLLSKLETIGILAVA